MDLLTNRLNVNTHNDTLLIVRAQDITELFKKGKCWKVSKVVITVIYCVSTMVGLLALVQDSSHPNLHFLSDRLLQTLLLITHSLVVPLPVLPCSRKAQRTHREAPSPLGTSNEGLKCLLLGGSCSGARWELLIRDVRYCAIQGSY